MGNPNRAAVPAVLRAVLGRVRKATSAARRRRQRRFVDRPGSEPEETSPQVDSSKAAPSEPGEQTGQASAGPAAADELAARLTGIRWIVDGRDAPALQITGFAYRRESASVDATVELILEGAAGPVRLPTRQLASDLVNVGSGEETYDHSNAAFEAELDTAELPVTADSGAAFDDNWQVTVSVTDRIGELAGRIRSRDAWASPGEGHCVDIGDGRLARPDWDDERGLLINVVRRHAVAEEITMDGTVLDAVVGCRGGFRATTAWIRRGKDVREVEVAPVPGRPARTRIRMDLAGFAGADADDPRPRSWYLQLADADGVRRYVHWQGQVPRGHRVVSAADQRIAIRFSPNGLLRVDIHPRRLAADRVQVDPDRLTVTISGECHGIGTASEGWRLDNGRVAVPCDALDLSAGRFSARFPLRAGRPWTERPLPLPQGGYRLRVSTDGADVDAIVTPALAESLGAATMTAVAEVRPEQNPKRLLHLRIRPPLAATELGKYHQARLRDSYRTVPATPEDAVYFESFSGTSANDNTLAIYRELARRRPDLAFRWGVTDLSVDLPSGAEPVLMRGVDWWQSMANSRYVVTNCWMMTHFERGPHQRVLQTWHGTPLKLLGFDRIGTNRGGAYREKTLREVAQWSQLIAQNPYSAEAFRRAYGFGNEMLEIGYPRNDILSDPAADQLRAQLRARLGLADGEYAVLYVPTWREGAKGLFRELDFDLLIKRLGANVRLLVRGHINTVRNGSAVTGSQVLDVTLYPDVSDLYLAADLMITDYSSTMFDFSVTGKPMIFFAPDLEQYSGSARGTYFDLAESAPGPVLATTDEVVEALRNVDELQTRYATAYAAWQQRFNPYDDGHAAERAVDALLR